MEKTIFYFWWVRDSLEPKRENATGSFSAMATSLDEALDNILYSKHVSYHPSKHEFPGRFIGYVVCHENIVIKKNQGTRVGAMTPPMVGYQLKGEALKKLKSYEPMINLTTALEEATNG